MNEDRAITLLKAAYHLLNKQKESFYVLNLLCETAFYDGADCDGYCLMDDIEDYLTKQGEADGLEAKQNTTTQKEPLNCTGCQYLDEQCAPCAICIRARRYKDYYRRPPEGEVDGE